MGMVSFQVFDGGSDVDRHHFIVQMVAIPADEGEGNSLIDFFEKKGLEEGMRVVKQGLDGIEDIDAYFMVESNGKSLLLVPGDQGVNLRFGSMCVAEFLGTPERWDWKQCVVSREEEEKDCLAWRKLVRF